MRLDAPVFWKILSVPGRLDHLALEEVVPEGVDLLVGLAFEDGGQDGGFAGEVGGHLGFGLDLDRRSDPALIITGAPPPAGISRRLLPASVK